MFRILICDDEKNCIDEIKKYTVEYFKEISQEVSFDAFTDGEAALKSDLSSYDIAFLDIVMGNVKGMQIAEKIQEVNPHTLFFFITAYDQYLDEAMNLRALRFLTKPLDRQRFISGIETAVKMIDKSGIEFKLKSRDSVHKVISNDIIFIEIAGRSTKVVAIQGTFTSTNRIEFWQEKLSGSYFYRVHNSYIINSNHITKYKRDSIVLDDQYRIPIAYRMRTLFRKYYLQRVEEMQK